MSGYINVWLDEADFQYIIYVLRKHEPDRDKTIKFHVSDYIPDFHISPDESCIQKIYLPGHPKNPLPLISMAKSK